MAESSTKKSIAVLGAGASGLYFLNYFKNIASGDYSITVYEKLSSCGKKLTVTGNGKCNFTNLKLKQNNYDECFNLYNLNNEKVELLENVFKSHSVDNIIEFLDSIGLPSYEKDGYVYPLCNQARVFRDILYSNIDFSHVVIKENCEVIDISYDNNKYKIKSTNGTDVFDYVVCALGSPAYYQDNKNNIKNIFKNLDINILDFHPSLLPIKAIGVDGFLENTSGVRTYSTLKLFINKKLIHKEEGELQLTKDYFSGIVAFNINSYVSKYFSCGGSKDGIYIEIDFLPSYTEDKLKIEIENRKTNFSKNKTDELLYGLLNDKLAQEIIHISGNNTDEIIKNIKHFMIVPVQNNNFKNAQSSIGGVDVLEIDNKTLESKKYKNLFFAGECTDIDGLCGGYNLSFAFASSAVIAKSVASSTASKM